VRAVGRIVVWVDAAAELSTIRISSRERTSPMPLVPNTSPPRVESTSKLAVLPRPIPLLPTPANACAPTMTST